ncbi:hypothetical protein [Zobellia uliginosa]|uniref:hypothetical protein n=1 Tax=Zobellia uliginosa TaxID=143224 RepID=UPI001C07378C|nr:hypothetical protein [Zobellia uliginosa]MBU2945165.1 hypothetical protein [Zobellia uliginosa]
MKPILILLFVLNFGTIVPSNTIVNVKNHHFKMDSVLAFSFSNVEIAQKDEISSSNSLVRLYNLKEYRVKKALNFVTQLDKPRLV